jgi:hypothetical protein
MPVRSRVLLLAMVAGVALASTPGCLLFVAGAGTGATAVWYYGAARETVDADPERVVAAAAAVLTDMGIGIESRAATTVDGRVVGRTAQDDKVEVLVNVRSSGETRISVRVGWVDDDAADRILDAIVARL